MQEDKVIYGSRQALESIIYYYLSSISTNLEDAKEIIVSELGTMINLSAEQLSYVKTQLASENKIVDNFDMCIKLLNNIITTETMDMEAIKIVKDVLTVMKNTAEKALIDNNTNGTDNE